MRRRGIWLLAVLVVAAASPARSQIEGEPYRSGGCYGAIVAVVPETCSHAESSDPDGSVSAAVHLATLGRGKLPGAGQALSSAGYRVIVDIAEPVALIEVSAEVFVRSAAFAVSGRGAVRVFGGLTIWADGPCDDCYPNGDQVTLLDSKVGLRSVRDVTRSISLGYSPVCEVQCSPLVPAGRYTFTLTLDVDAELAPGRGAALDATADAVVRFFRVTTHAA